MFQIESFIDECQAAVEESDALSAVSELVARIVSEPAQVLRALGEPERSEVQTIYKASDLTILNVCWGRAWRLIRTIIGCGRLSASMEAVSRTRFIAAATPG